METEELRKKLYDLCEKTETSKKGIDMLVNYYINSLGWDEKQSLTYAMGLFKNDVIDEIKVIGNKEE